MAGTQVESYEEVRRRQLEENKRKLEELKLGHLSVALREASTPKISSPAKQVKRKPAQEGYTIVKRRSDRIANLPEQTYKEVIKKQVERKAAQEGERRSDRIANLPKQTYKEENDADSDIDDDDDDDVEDDVEDDAWSEADAGAESDGEDEADDGNKHDEL